MARHNYPAEVRRHGEALIRWADDHHASATIAGSIIGSLNRLCSDWREDSADAYPMLRDYTIEAGQ